MSVFILIQVCLCSGKQRWVAALVKAKKHNSTLIAQVPVQVY